MSTVNIRALETESAKWNAAIINVMNSTCAFPALASENVSEKEPVKRWNKQKQNICAVLSDCVI